MPYQAGDHLPGERASKLGHLEVLQSSLVNELVERFEYPPKAEKDESGTQWKEFVFSKAKPLTIVAAVDGSVQSIQSETYPPRELAFVKTALLRMDKPKIDLIDPEYPHPLQLKALMAESALFHATVFPLKNIRMGSITNYDAIRGIVRDSMRKDLDGVVYETLKWLAYQKWTGTVASSPAFECPHCGDVVAGLPYDDDELACEHCGKVVFLTDMIGFHLEMAEEAAPQSVATAYMLIHETLLLFSFVKHYWERGWKGDLSNALFIKDGPLTLRSQYSKLVPLIRSFLQFSKDQGCAVHLIGQEKSGVLFEHLKSITRFAPPKTRGSLPTFAILSHRYVRDEIYRTPNLLNPYGKRTNYGEKVFVKLDPYSLMVLNVPTGAYRDDPDFPRAENDLIGFDQILATLPSLLSHRHEGALIPVELANGVASLSSYPSAKVLAVFAGLGG